MGDRLIDEIKDVQYLVKSGKDIAKDKVSKDQGELASTFYLYLLDGRTTIQSRHIKISNASDLRDALVLQAMNKLNNKEEIESFIEKSIDSYKKYKTANNLPLVYKIIQNLLVFYDLTRKDILLKNLKMALGVVNVQDDEVKAYKDYFNTLVNTQNYKINTEEWGSKKETILEAIKIRTLFLNGQKIPEYLVAHYRKIAELSKKYSFSELRTLSRGSFSDFIVLLSLLVKSGYLEGVFIPKIEKISYFEKILGKKTIIKEIRETVEKDIFKISMKGWEDDLKKYTVLSFIPKSFGFRWSFLSIVVPSLLFLGIRKIYPIEIPYLILFVIGSLGGGLLVYRIIKNNLKASPLLN